MPTRKEHRLSDHPDARMALVKLGKAIKEYRKKTGVTMMQFADMVGCSHCVIAHVEAGENYPSFAVYYFICKTMGFEMGRM